MCLSDGWHSPPPPANLAYSMGRKRSIFPSRIFHIQSSSAEPTQTRIYQKKYVKGSVNWERHLKKLKTRRDAYLGLHLFIYVIKSPIQLVRQSL